MTDYFVFCSIFLLSVFAFSEESISLSSSVEHNEPYKKIVSAVQDAHPSMQHESDEYEIEIDIPGHGSQKFDCKRQVIYNKTGYSISVHANGEYGVFYFWTVVTPDGNIEHSTKIKSRHLTKIQAATIFRINTKKINDAIEDALDDQSN